MLSLTIAFTWGLASGLQAVPPPRARSRWLPRVSSMPDYGANSPPEKAASAEQTLADAARAAGVDDPGELGMSIEAGGGEEGIEGLDLEAMEKKYEDMDLEEVSSTASS